MIYRVPITPGVPDQEFELELQGTTYVLRFRWNDRRQQWTLELSDANRDLLLVRPVVLGVWVLSRFAANLRLPPGDFLLLDTATPAAEPGLNDLGARVQLYYLEVS